MLNTAPAPALADVAFPAPRAEARFLRQHLAWPLAGALLASAVLMGAGGDQALADLVYRLEGGHWLLQDHWFTRDLVHRGGKLLSTGAGVAVLGLAVLAWCRPALARLRWPASYLALTVALSTAGVSVLKSVTGMDCPWDLERYGGSRPFIGLFASRHGLPASGCFPAGHASAGYAWVGLYFVALALRPAWRGPALAVALGGGLLFGLSQQLRGAHFLSHDLWSLATCWLVALALYRLTWPRAAAARAAARVQGAVA